ncbi:hypothetical protein S245_023610 [Arachis hypogaea]
MKLIEIRRWLTQPHVWRFVGLGSSVVGLFCYAVSSSFNNLFGEWTFLKIFFYTQLSLIICIAIFYAKVWQSSRSLRFKGHMAFLVLTITSAYSFFLDNKAVKKKPDAFSLISCLAFSIMSLCLSRQIPCGFEVDLMYFFLGALIVQLMKIKLWLGILGVGFSYTLNILRSSLDENLHEGAGLQEDQRNVVIQVEEEEEEESISPQPPRFMSVIQELQRANWGLVEVLWCHLKEYLVDNDDQIPIPMTLVNDHNFLINALPPKAVDDLHEKVKLMMDSGFKNECSNQYNSWRREFLEMCLSMLRLKVTNKIEGVDERERIRRWVKASNVVLRIVLPNERRLCDQVFLGFSSFADVTFMLFYSDVVTTLQKLANDFVTERRSSLTRLPSMVKVVGTLQDLIPELDDSVFAAQRSEAVSIMELETLEEATKDYYCTNIENLI